MKSLIRASLNKPVSTLMLYSGFLLVGFLAAKALPREYYPSVQPPRLFVSARYPASSPEEVKTLIAVPLERTFSALSGLKSIRSLSRTGSTAIELEFHWGTDILMAGIKVRELIDSRYPSLPAKAEKPTVLTVNPNQKPLMEIAVVSPKGDLNLVRRLSQRELITAFQMVPGVGSVNIIGGTAMEIAVIVDQERALARGLGGDTISAVIASENISLPAGTIEEGGIEYLVKSEGRLENPGELTRIWISPQERTPFMIGDIAAAVMQQEKQKSLYILNNQECICLTILRQEGSDPVSLAKKVRGKVEELNFRYSDQVELVIISDSSVEISDTIRSLVFGLVTGACAAFFVILLLLGNWKYSLILILTIPCSLALSLTSLYLLDVSLNTLSLGGLTLGTGMLVDSSVVVLEHLAGSSAWREKGTVFARTAEMARSIGASTATSIIVFAPLFFLPGFLGALYKDLALAIATALAASFLVSITLTPVLYHLIPAPLSSGSLKKNAWWYGKLLLWCSRRQWILYLVPITLLLTVSLTFYLLPRRFMPLIPERELHMDLDFPPGTLIKSIKETGLNICAAIRNLPGIDYVTAHTGQEEYENQIAVNPEESAAVLHIRAAVTEEKNYSAVYRTIHETISGWGVPAKLSPPGDLLSSILGISEQAAFTVSASSTAEVLLYLDSLNIAASAFPEALQEEIHILPLRRRMARTGVTVEMLGTLLSSFLNGSDAGSMWLDGDEYPVRVYVTGEQDSINSLRNFPISVSEGGSINLGSVGEITRVSRTAALYRSGKTDTNLIRIFEGSENPRIIKDVAAVFPHTVSPDISPLKKEAYPILSTFAAALILLYLVLAAQFESFKEPLIILSTIPLSASGTGLMLLLTGGTLNIQSALALLVLFGLAVNNAIILRDRIIASPITPIACAQSRLRPISITAFTTIAALIPTAGGFFGPTPQKELALAIIGGLALSTVTTLLLIPLFSLKGKPKQ